MRHDPLVGRSGKRESPLRTTHQHFLELYLGFQKSLSRFSGGVGSNLCKPLFPMLPVLRRHGSPLVWGCRSAQMTTASSFPTSGSWLRRSLPLTQEAFHGTGDNLSVIASPWTWEIVPFPKACLLLVQRDVFQVSEPVSALYAMDTAAHCRAEFWSFPWVPSEGTGIVSLRIWFCILSKVAVYSKV